MMMLAVTTHGGIMQALYSFGAPRIGRTWGEGITISSIWSGRWRPNLRRDFWRRVWDGDFLPRRVHRRHSRGLHIAMCMALLGVLVASASSRLSTGVSLRMGMTERNAFWDGTDAAPMITVVSDFSDMPDWTERPVNTDEWSVITVSNPEVSAAIFMGVVEKFLDDRPDLADVRLLLEQANGRVPHAVSMALADLSESVGASLRMGLRRDEVAALARLTSEYVMSLATKGSE